MPRGRAPCRLPTRAERRANTERRNAHNRPPPNPDTWHMYLCDRCEQPFKFQGIARHCVRCVAAAAAAGFKGSELIGEASGE